jgi:hypothetical protein
LLTWSKQRGKQSAKKWLHAAWVSSQLFLLASFCFQLCHKKERAFDKKKKGCIIVVVQQIVAPEKKSDTKLFHPVSVSAYVVDRINLVPQEWIRSMNQ